MMTSRLTPLAILPILLALGGCSGQASSSIAPATPAGSPSANAVKPSGPAASVSQQPASSAPIRLASSQNVTGNAPVWLTGQAGLFQKNGLNLDLQSISATTAIKDLVAGHIDATVAGAPESISARAESADIQIVAVFQNACDMQLVAAKDVASVDQLKGKTVAVITKPSVNGICTVADLRNHGLAAGKDYKLIETGSAGTYSAMVAAIQAHHADAGAMQTNFARKLADSGQFHILYDLAAEKDLKEAASSLTFASSFIQAHPAEVQKTLDSLLEGQQYFKQHKAEAQGVLKTTFKITDQAELDAIYDRLVQLMAGNVTPNKDLFPDIVDALTQVQPKVKALDLGSLLNPRFAQDAAKRGLTG